MLGVYRSLLLSTGLISLSLLLVPNSAFCKTSKKLKKKKAAQLSGESTDDESESKTKTPPNTSLVKRENKTVDLKLDLLGFTPSITFGASAAYHLSTNQVIEFRYGSAKSPFATMQETMMSIALKSFWGNSFYTLLGLGKRDYKYQYVLLGTDENDAFTAVLPKGQISSLGLETAIGNQWQWDYFTMGIDWLGFFIPLSSTGPSEIDVGTAKIPQDQLDASNSELQFAKKAQLSYLRFYLGIAF